MKTQEKLNFQCEKIDVDWISFKFQSLEIASQRKLVNYLFELGFNCFVQSGKLRTLENEELKVSRLNPNSVLFVKDGPYWDGTLLHFSGKNAKQFYQYAKTNSINWNLFSNAVLSRLDLCYISDVPIDSESVEDFFYCCHAKLKLNVNYEKNKEGQILKLGNRRSNKFSRIYIEQNRLKFEHEMKGSFIKQYSQYLTTNSWNDFEFLLSQHFFHYLGSQLLVVDSPYLAWLSKKITSLQFKTSSTLTFTTDYVHSSIKVKEQKRIIQFLKFLIYVRDLDYDSEFLGDIRYRCVTFKLNHFLEFLHGPNYRSEYQLKKLQDFCDDIQKDFFVRSVSDRHFQSLIAVPVAKVYKEKDWMGKFWIVDDLFYSNYPSSFAGMFDSDLSKSKFFVLFEIFKMLETEL